VLILLVISISAAQTPVPLKVDDVTLVSVLPANVIWEKTYGGSADDRAFFAAPAAATVDFLIGQFGTHVFINMVWGTIFGMIYPKVYSLVLGKGVMKGLIYGLTVFLITGFQYTIWFWSMAAFHKLWLFVATTGPSLLVGFIEFLVFGLVLGALYKK